MLGGVVSRAGRVALVRRGEVMFSRESFCKTDWFVASLHSVPRA